VTAATVATTARRARLLAILKAQAEPRTARELAELAGQPRSTTSGDLSYFERNYLAEFAGFGPRGQRCWVAWS
jgi:DNA-binding IclR family transcriptional regulator